MPFDQPMKNRITLNDGRPGVMSDPIDSKGTRKVQVKGQPARLYTGGQVKRFIKGDK